ncbi:MAG: N-acyl homoserine lactonase family protein [Alphaproteobacteria bacterium]|nr:MAG: N-acyl homoserine lactonase family protein [Alphaproteobacteria bacterium]
MSDIWEIYALRYATRANRTRSESFLFDDDHSAPHPLDYYVWVLKNGTRSILVDTGFDAAEGKLRNRPIFQSPAEMLTDFGLPASDIDTVIVTHMHYDHAGSLHDFRHAKLYVQPREIEYVTGPCMCHGALRQPFTGDHVIEMVRSLYLGNVEFCEGSREIAPGVEVHLIGGHTRGQQCVRVRTRRGWVVLASDSSHFYENYRAGKPFPIVVDMEDTLRGYDLLRRLADSDDHIIPGHDPLTREWYPMIDGGSENIVLLHADPKV